MIADVMNESSGKGIGEAKGEPVVLMVEGVASDRAAERLRAGLPDFLPSNSVICFASYAPAEFPVGTVFEACYPEGDPAAGVSTAAILVAVTQQFSRAFEAIPAGWKTVCALHFVEGVPDLVAQLPVVDAWFRSERRLGLCSRQTWKALREQAMNGDMDERELLRALDLHDALIVRCARGELDFGTFPTEYRDFFAYWALDGHESNPVELDLLRRYADRIRVHQRLWNDVLCHLTSEELAADSVSQSVGFIGPAAACERLLAIATDARLLREDDKP